MKATTDKLKQDRARAEQSVLAARERLQDAVQDMNGRVQENPWTAVGIAAGIGLLAGILLARK
jgi:ElaB/YqjD/DUF883 family membrane-anchored ribosome-binding protein